MIYLIVGLGNPGKRYEGTRHNIGFKAVSAFAEKHQVFFKKKESFQSELAEIRAEDRRIYLLKPLTFMNLSGHAVRRCIDFFQVPIASHLLVVVDDVAIPFGEFRLKGHGSSGGHHGLDSIDEQLGTNSYPRLRIGIGRQKEDLASYVLEEFSSEEKEKLPRIIDKAVEYMEFWMNVSLPLAMNRINIRGVTQEGED